MRAAALLALCVLLAGCSGYPWLGSTPRDESPQTVTPTTTSIQTPTASATGTASTTVTRSPTAPPSRTPTASPTGTPTARPTSPSHVEVRGDDQRLPVNATAVWRRVLDLHGLSPTAFRAPVVTVRSASEQTFAETELDGDRDRFGWLLGLNENHSEPVTLTSPDAFVYPPEYTDGNYARVRLELAEDDPAAAAEATLAHEYVHVVQIETNFSLSAAERAELQERVPRSIFADIREGAAEYVADVYAERYLEGVDIAAERRAAYDGANTNAWKLSRAGYYYGYRHVRARVDSPESLPSVYETPPETDEQLIHGQAPSEEPPVSLSARAGEGWDRRGTVGELELQVALTEQLPVQRAADAAAGWGNDTLLRHGGDYVWVIRMDDAAEAAELEAPLRAHLEWLTAASDPIDRPADVSYQLVRVDEETLALVVGDRGFLEDVRIRDDRGTVAISLESGETPLGG